MNHCQGGRVSTNVAINIKGNGARGVKNVRFLKENTTFALSLNDRTILKNIANPDNKASHAHGIAMLPHCCTLCMNAWHARLKQDKPFGKEALQR